VAVPMNERITIRLTDEVNEALEQLRQDKQLPMQSRQDAFRYIVEAWLTERGYLPRTMDDLNDSLLDIRSTDDPTK
jgi:hypothetical protein